MRYLADTDVVVNHIRGKLAITELIFQKGLSISIITYGELLYGAWKSHYKEKTLKIISNFIRNLEIQILNLDENILFEYAEIKVSLEKAGQRLSDFDLLIAATAKRHNLTLLTRNLKHFSRVSNLKIN